MNSNNFGTVKDESLPAQKGSPCDLGNSMQQADKEIKMYEGMSDADKAASKSIQKFLLAIPPASHSQFLAKIGSDEFFKTFASVSLGAAGSGQVKFEHDPDMQLGSNAISSEDKAYAAFIAAQSETSKEEYECFKRKYAATNCFGNAKIPFQTFTSGFQVTSAPHLGDQTIAKVVLHKNDRGDTPLAQQKTCNKVVCAIKPEIQTCKISRILTSNDESSYDVATDALSSQTIIQGINRYIIQYDFSSIIIIPHGISSAFTPASISSSTKWLHAINDFNCLNNHQYLAWQEFILRHETDVEIESNDWLKGTLLQSMEVTLCAEVESDLQGLPVNHHGAVTMLRFIIKCLIIRNQEAWDALEDYAKTFDIRNFPGKNVPTACLKLKAVINVLGNKTPSNAVCTILEGFAHGVVHAYMGQKLLKPYILKVFWLTDYELFHATFD
jgi:hypothetical protein